MKKTILVATIGALALGVQAGDWGKAPVSSKAPIEECVDLGGTIGVGYHTDYIFKGLRLAGDSVSANVAYTIDGLAVPVTIGADYVNGINESWALGGGGFDQLALSATANLGTFAGFDVSLGYTHYIYPEIRSNISPVGDGFGELGLNVRRSLGFADVVFGTNYAMGGAFHGWYYQLGLEKSIGLTDNINLVLGAGVAYSDNYFNNFVAGRDSGWSHYYATASLPIKLNCRTTLTPYIGFIGTPDTWVLDGAFGSPAGNEDILHGGVTLSVSF